MGDPFNLGPPGPYDPGQYIPEKAKNVYFFKQGAIGNDAKPLRMIVTHKRYRNFDALLDEITDKVPGLIFGVTHVYAVGTRKEITSLDELEDGGTYSCEGKVGNQAKWAEPRPPPTRQNVPPKRITFVRAADQNDRQSLLLNRQTTQSFDQILADVSQLFPGLYARKLYTLDGAPITSLTALYNGPDVLMVGRVENTPGGGRHSSVGGLPQQAARKLGVKTRSEYKSKGRWKVWVTTGDTPSAGTTGRVFLSAYGNSGVAGPLSLGLGEGTAFQTGNIDEFDVNLGSTGPLYKIRVSHDNSGSSPNWFCEEVRMKDIDTGEELVFPYRRWLSRTEDDLDIHRELPVTKRGGKNLPVGVYSIDVFTGGVQNAGTEANIYATVYGEHGDAGNRQLYNGKGRNFAKGQQSRFQMEAVSLGNLTHMVVGHDGRGAGNGWFLDKIIVKEQFGQHREWVFRCNRWLDEGQDDKKIIRDLYPGGADTPARPESVTNFWDLERWKYELRNLLVFYNASTSRSMCFRPGNNIDSTGEDNDRKSNKSVFEVCHVRNDYRAFVNCAQRGACIAIKNGAPTVQPSANQVNLSNSFCEFKPMVSNSDRRTSFESAKQPGQHWCITPNGNATDCRSVGGMGPLKEFYVYCKGVFRDGGLIQMIAANNLTLALDKDGKRAVAMPERTKLGQFRVVKVAEGGLRMFESSMFSNQFLQIKNGACSCQGIGDRYSQFRVSRIREKAYYLIQSVAYPGSYIALTASGKVQQVTDPGSAAIIFYPEVIQFGTPKQRKQKTPVEQPPSRKRAPSMPPPPSPVQPTPKQQYVPPSPSPSPEPEPRVPEVPTPQPTAIRHPAPQAKNRFNEGDWLVWISTHETAINGNVGLAVYGTRGTSGTIMLGGPSRNMFKQGTKDQFLINLKELGELYKIRLEFYPISFASDSAWKIAEAQLHDMTTNELLRFSFNRHVSLTEDDGDLMRELPAIRPGVPILTIYNYYVEAETGYVDGAQTTANVYLQIFGQRGDSGRRLLHRSTGNTLKWQPGQTDKFLLDAVDLSTLTKCLVAVDTREPGAGWYLSKVIIREWENAQQEYTFPCNRWFDVGRDDGQTERFLFPSSPAPGPRSANNDTPPPIVKAPVQAAPPPPPPPQQPQQPFYPQPIIIFAQPPAPAFPYLPPPFPYYQQQQPLPPIPKNEPPQAAPQPGEWNVWVTTGEGSLKGKAEMWAYGIGRIPKAGPLALGSGTAGHFKVNTTDNFKVVINPSVGSLYKIRIGHLDKENDEWYVDKVLMKNLETEESLTFWIRRWMGRTQDDFDVVRESPAIRPNKDPLELCIYHVEVKLGDQRGIKSDTEVHVEIRGTRGDTGLRLLYYSLNNKTNKFQPGGKDIFLVEAVDLEDVTELLIGHKNGIAGKGFFIENVIITLESPRKQRWFLPCSKWFDKGEDDGEIERILRPGEAPKDGDWLIITHTGRDQEMATADEVVLWAYGDKGRVGPLTLAKARTNKFFRPDAVDEFKVYMPTPSLGQMYKIRIGRSEEADDQWFLNSVVAKHRYTNDVLEFDCRRWLSRRNDDLDVWRELPAVWPDKRPLPIYRYRLEVFTGLKPGSDTDARVYVELRGKRGDAGPRVLFKSLNGNSKKFKTGQMDVFEIEAVDLDDLKELLVGHNCQERGGGWFLERIAVFLSSEQTKGQERAWYFSCNKWLDKGEGDGAIERILYPGDPPKDEGKRAEGQAGEWNLWTTTGSEPDMATDDTVVVWAYGYGDKGKAGPIQLGVGKNELFRATKTDEFRIMIDPKVGELYKIRIGRAEDSQEPWFLEKVKMKNLQKGDVYDFKCDRWLSRKKDDRDVWRELPFSHPGKSTLPILKYYVEVYTGSDPGSDTEANCYVEIRGNRGDTGVRKLYKSLNNPGDMFKLKQMDKFLVEAVDLDDLTEILLGHDCQDRGGGWFVDHVIIRLEEPQKRAWYFPCKRWFDRSQDDSRIERVLKVGDFPVQAPPPQEKKLDYDWEVQITTGNSEPACGKQANTIQLWAYGSDDVAGPLILGSGKDKDGNYFRSGNVDTFKVKLGDERPGKLYKIRFGHEEDEDEKSTWHVEKVKIKEMKNDEETVYKCGRWLSRTHEDKDVWRELPTPGPNALPILIYEVSIATGKLPGSDTEARCFIQLFGSRGDSGKRILYWSRNNKKKFQEDQVDVFHVEAVDLDDLQKIYIGHKDSASGAGWYIDRVSITTKTKSGEQQWYFPCSKWFDAGQDDKKTERFLYPGAPPGESKGVYKVIIKTAKDSGKAPANKKITLAIYGEQNKTNDNELQPKSTTPFQPDQEDEAQVKAIGIGKIYKIRVGHADKFAPFDWHLEWVKLIDTGTEEEMMFAFDKWLSLEKAQDSHLDREASLASAEQRSAIPLVIYYVGIYIGDHWFSESGESLFYVSIAGSQGDTGKRYLFYTAAKKKAVVTRGKMLAFPVEAVDLLELKSLTIGFQCQGHGSGTFVDIIRVSTSTDTGSSLVFPCGRWFDPWEDDGLCERTLRYVDKIPAKEQLSRHDTKAPRLPTRWKVMTKSGPDTVKEFNTDVYMTVCGSRGDSKREKLSNGKSSSENFAANNVAEFEFNSGDNGNVKKIRLDTFSSNGEEGEPLNLDWVKLTDASGTTNYQYLFYMDRWFSADTDDGSMCRELAVTQIPTAQTGAASAASGASGKSVAPKSSEPPITPAVISYVLIIETGGASKASNGLKNGSAKVVIAGADGDTGERYLLRSLSQTGSGTVFGKPGTTDIFLIPAVYLGKLTEVHLSLIDSAKSAGNWQVKRIRIRRSEHDVFETVFNESRFVGSEPVTKFDEPEVELSPAQLQYERRFQPAPTPPSGNYKVTIIAPDGTSGGKPQELTLTAYSASLKKSEPLDLLKLTGSLNKPVPFQASFGSIGPLMKIRISAEGDGNFKWKIDKVLLLDTKTKQELLCAPVRELVYNDKTGGHGQLEIGVIRPDIPPIPDVHYELAIFTGDKERGEPDAPCYTVISGAWGDTGRIFLTESDQKTLFKRNQIDICDIDVVSVGPVKSVGIGHISYGRGLGWYIDEIHLRDEYNISKPVVVCPAFRWLDTGTGDRKVYVDLVPVWDQPHVLDNMPEKFSGTFDCRLLTTSDPGEARTITVSIFSHTNVSTKQDITLNPLDSVTEEGQTFTISEPRLKEPRKLRVEDSGAPNWCVKEIFAIDKETGEELHFNFSHICGRPNDGCREHPVVRYKHHTPSQIEYYVRLFERTDAASNKGVKVKINIEGSTGNSGTRKCTAKKITSSGADFTVEAVSLGTLQAIQINKEANSAVIQRATIKEGRFGATEYIFRWEEDPGKPEDALKYRLTFEGTGLSADTAAPKSAASVKSAGSAKKGATPMSMQMDPNKAEQIKAALRDALKKNGLEGANVS